MLDAFSLRKVSIDDMPEVAIQAIARVDQSFLRVLIVPWPAFLNRLGSLLAQQGNAVMTLLAEVFNVKTHFFNQRERKLFVMNFGFLQAYDIRIELIPYGFDLVRAGTHTVNIKTYESRHFLLLRAN